MSIKKIAEQHYRKVMALKELGEPNSTLIPVRAPAVEGRLNHVRPLPDGRIEVTYFRRTLLLEPGRYYRQVPPKAESVYLEVCADGTLFSRSRAGEPEPIGPQGFIVKYRGGVCTRWEPPEEEDGHDE